MRSFCIRLIFWRFSSGVSARAASGRVLSIRAGDLKDFSRGMGEGGEQRLEESVKKDSDKTNPMIRKAPCPVPVLVISNSSNKLTTAADAGHRLGRLYGTPFPTNSALAWDYAISLTSEYRAELTPLHVGEEETRGRARAGATIGKCTEELAKLISKEEPRDLNQQTACRFGEPMRRWPDLHRRLRLAS